MNGKVADFLRELVIHYPVRFEDEASEREWLRSMHRALSNHSPDLLKRAAERIIETRTVRSFPLIGEINKVVSALRYDDDNAKQYALAIKGPEASQEWTRDRIGWADRLIMGEMGRIAAEEGWILALHDHIVRNGKLPDGGEAHSLRRKAQDLEAGIDEAHRPIPTDSKPVRGTSFRKPNMADMQAELRKLGASMMARRQKLTDMVLHGVCR